VACRRVYSLIVPLLIFIWSYANELSRRRYIST
jgi:hypothetical protein